MKWTTKKPDRPGWWWAREKPGKEEVIKVTLIEETEGVSRNSLKWDTGGDYGPRLLEEYHTEWSDQPLKMPEENANKLYRLWYHEKNGMYAILETPCFPASWYFGPVFEKFDMNLGRIVRQIADNSMSNFHRNFADAVLAAGKMGLS